MSNTTHRQDRMFLNRIFTCMSIRAKIKQEINLYNYTLPAVVCDR